MDITLEQSLAAAVRYIQDNAIEGTKLYFDEIPEDFYVPSVYFQVPYTAGKKVTLRSYRTTLTMNCWFMEAKDWDAYARAADMRDCLMMDDCKIPVFNEDGEPTGTCLRIGEPDTHKIDEGIVQLSFTIDAYFHPEKSHTKMQQLHIAWKNITQKIKEQEAGRYGC